jgi:hypothetical protein
MNMENGERQNIQVAVVFVSRLNNANARGIQVRGTVATKSFTKMFGNNEK